VVLKRGFTVVLKVLSCVLKGSFSLTNVSRVVPVQMSIVRIVFSSFRVSCLYMILQTKSHSITLETGSEILKR